MKLRRQETMLNITKEETPEGTKFTMSQNKIDPEKYVDFVRQTTSQPSLDWPTLSKRLTELEVKDDCNVTQLMTAAFGLTAEAGEFAEVVKKMFLQGKPYTEENVFHMKREMGDIMWYMAQACMALDTDFDEILSMNVEKLSARYPEGTFDVQYSENRKEGDV
jgi:NTP pyrophosphatase (non-canonical NTP hydrolase)